jgi:hypothetical protein
MSDSPECRFCHTPIHIAPGLELDEDACHVCLIGYLREENERLRRWLKFEVRGRLIEYLVDLAKVVDGKMLIRKVPRHQQIADAIYSSRETASRELSKLKREGLVVPSGRGWARMTLTLDPMLLTDPALADGDADVG